MIQDIYNRLQKLVKKHELLTKENEKWKEALQQQSELLLQYETKINTLELQLTIQKNSPKKLDDKAKQAFEKRINDYIKTIDNAITLLNE